MFNLYVLNNATDWDFTKILKRRVPDKHTILQVVFFEQKKLSYLNRWLEKMFQQFWLKKILNVVIIFWSTRLNVVTYSPFGKPFLRFFRANQTDYRILFRDKTNNFMGEPLRIGLFYEESRAIFNKTLETHQINITTLDGVDGLQARLIIEHMNATIKIVQPTDGADIGEFLANGSSTGSLRLLVTDQVDVSLNARFFRSSQFHLQVEPTITVGRDDICILVHRSGMAPNIGNIFRSFHYSVWISILIATPAFAIVLKLFYNRYANLKHSHLGDLLMKSVGWNLIQPSDVLPKYTTIRLLVGFWVFYCLLITSAYNGNLISNLLLDQYLPDITTLRQLDKSGYTVLTYHRYVDLIQRSLNNTDLYRNLQNNILSVPEDEFFERIASMDTRYAYANKYHINTNILNDPRMNDIFHQMTECPVPFVLVYGVSYGTAFKWRINRILRQTIESGLIAQWEKRRNHAHKRKSRSLHNQKHRQERFSIHHLQSAFYILCMGLILSFIVFMFEKFHLKLRQFYNFVYFLAIER